METFGEGEEANSDDAEVIARARTSRRLEEVPEAVFAAVEAARPRVVFDDVLGNLLGQGEGEGTERHVDGPLEDPREGPGDAAALEEADEAVEGVVLEDAGLRRHHRVLRLLEGVEACREGEGMGERRLRRRRQLCRRVSPARWPPSRLDDPGSRS